MTYRIAGTQRTKVVCTIGPACRTPEMLQTMLRVGMDVARINFSHGDHASHEQEIARLRDAAAAVGRPLAILADLQGPKLRVGTVQPGGVLLDEGAEVILTNRDITGHEGEIPIQFAPLPTIVAVGDTIYLDDGLIALRVVRSDDTDIVCHVITGGVLESNKGMNLPHAPLGIPAITEKDVRDLEFALAHGVDWIGLSFVRRPEEILELKGRIGQSQVPVIAKIEKPQAMERIADIIAVADGVMVARGDLGIETSPEEVPLMQKRIIRLCNRAGKPVITATQMLDSMIRNPRPTRAEASDVANAVLDGSDAVMLSGETAIGKYPLLAVQTMVRVIEQVERAEPWEQLRHPLEDDDDKNIARAICRAAAQTAEALDASAIIAPTVSGYTARTLSALRPCTPIVAITPDEQVQRRLALFWGVSPLTCERSETTDAIIASSIAAAQQAGYVRPGETVVAVAGAAGSGPGTTDVMKVQTV